MAFSNSPLVEYKRLSPNLSGTRVYSISRITPHHVVGLLSVEALGAEFCGTRQASSNYGIGADGRVALYVPESCRAWTSSSWDNDNHAVTIECADSPTYPYEFPEVVYSKLIDLCADICRRNGKTKIIWISDKEKALSYRLQENEMLLTLHKWFTATSCPGAWLCSRMDDLAEKINERLGAGEGVPNVNTCTVELPILRYGDRGGSVKAMQILLNAQTCPGGEIETDGKFGPATRSKLLVFQNARSLSADAVCGPATWDSLHTF